jgi:hypothetical protein
MKIGSAGLQQIPPVLGVTSRNPALAILCRPLADRSHWRTRNASAVLRAAPKPLTLLFINQEAGEPKARPAVFCSAVARFGRKCGNIDTTIWLVLQCGTSGTIRNANVTTDQA